MASKSSDRWIMVRIDRTTRMLLMRLKQRWEGDASNTAGRRYDMVDRFGMSVDSVIRELIRREEDHRSRSRKSQQKRRKGKARQDQPDPSPTGDAATHK